MSNFYSTESKITCIDQFVITATIYFPTKDIKGAILIGPATGIKRQFYASFTSHLAKNGYGVLTFDNRGIGESLLGELRESNASLQCWGELDMPAALEALKKSFPNTIPVTNQSAEFQWELKAL